MNDDGGGRADTDDLALRAAWLYHVDGLTQAEVAARLFVSRPTIGRLLERARSSGLVRVEIDPEHLASFGLARRLQDRWHLRECVVVPSASESMSQQRRNERLAAAASTYVRRFLHPGTVVGVAWGDTIQRALAHLPPPVLDGVTLATLSGGIEHITRRIMGYPAIAGHLRAIPAPLIVSRSEVAASLREEPAVREVLELARSAAITLTGIGTALPGSSAARSGMLTDTDVASFAAAGAVGDMVGEFFLADGRVLSATSDRRIGVTLQELRRMPNVVGVAGGTDKVPAIRGALEGGYLDVLVTDEEAAERLLRRTRPPALAR